jgi:hypothetical protein
MLVAHAYNSTFSGGRDKEDSSSKQVKANSSRDPSLKKPFIKKDWCLNQQKPLFFPIIAYTLSTTKLEIRAK